MSYISFWQTTFTDAGEPRFDFKYKVPKTDPNEVKARAERGEKVISIFTKILIHLKDYATLRGENGLSESRTLEDVEIEEEDKIPSKTDLLNRNAVMNTFDYNYCKKCQRDVPPRAVHCGHCKR